MDEKQLLAIMAAIIVTGLDIDYSERAPKEDIRDAVQLAEDILKEVEKKKAIVIRRKES